MSPASPRPRIESSGVTSTRRQRAKRMPAEARKALILDEAAAFFASRGFSASTRDLADQIGVRQALLYKYYPSKDALIEAIFARLLQERSQGGRGRLEESALGPLAERISRFYENLAAFADGSGAQLTSRAAIEDLPVTQRLVAFLTQNLFLPMLEEIRAFEAAPGLEAQPMMRGEFEILMTFHAGAMFTNLRGRLDNLPAPEDTAAFMRLFITTFIAGVREAVRDLQMADRSSALAAPARVPP